MTLDEAIKYSEGVAYQKDLESGFDTDNERYAMTDNERANCKQCAEEHRQLAEWLKELKQLREQTRWIPVTERPPEENKTVIASTLYGVYPETKYTKEYGWEWAYESGADYWRGLENVTAWMLLPEPYKAESEE